MSVLRLPRARSPVLLLDADRSQASAGLLSVSLVVLLVFVVAFVAGTQSPRATVDPVLPSTSGVAPPSTAAGSVMTSLRLDPEPALPDLRKAKAPAGTKSPPPARAAAPPAAPATAPTTNPTPAAPQPVAPTVTPSRPVPAAKAKPSPSGKPFDSSG
jgi:hypothetical protein